MYNFLNLLDKKVINAINEQIHFTMYSHFRHFQKFSQSVNKLKVVLASLLKRTRQHLDLNGMASAPVHIPSK